MIEKIGLIRMENINEQGARQIADAHCQNFEAICWSIWPTDDEESKVDLEMYFMPDCKIGGVEIVSFDSLKFHNQMAVLYSLIDVEECDPPEWKEDETEYHYLLETYDDFLAETGRK